MGRPGRFPNGAAFKSYTGLAPRASETGNTDRNGQPMSKAGSSLLRTTLIRAVDNARRPDPQLDRIYYTQMVERGAEHLKAVCVVAGALAERAWTVMNRQMPYVSAISTAHRSPRNKRNRSSRRTTPSRRGPPATSQQQDSQPETDSATHHQQQGGRAPEQAA